MLVKPNTCASCPLGQKPFGKMTGFVPAAGSGVNGVLVVGDNPTEQEELEGSPLAGPGGRQFNRLLARAGYPRDEFRLANTVSCRPPGNRLAGEWYEHKALDNCAVHLNTAIDQMAPKVVIALGNIAMRRLTGFEGIRRYRGRPLPLLGHPGVWVMPTFHPSFLLPGREKEDGGSRNPARYTGAVILDLKRAFHIRDHGFQREPGTYLLDPSPAEFTGFVLEYEAALRADPEGVFLSWDIETPWKMKEGDEGELDLKEAIQDSGIIRISFAFREGYAASVPWAPEYLPGIRRLLASRGPKVTWNGWHFDEPTVRRNGVEINGVSHDGMWAWHLYQPDLDMGLEFVSSFATTLLPWKHLNSSDPVLYSAIDPDAALQNFLYTKRVLERARQWDLYLRHVVRMEPIWQAAGAAGVYIDIPKQTALRETLEAEAAKITTAVQPLVPEELKPKKRYKKQPFPSDVMPLPAARAVWNERTFIAAKAVAKVKACSVCSAEGVTKGAHFKGGKKNPCKAAGGEIVEKLGEVVQWDEVLPFNPNSTEQLKAFIRFHNHPMGRDPKDRSKAQANAKHIKKLIKSYGETFPLYRQVLDYHRISKTKSTYLPPPDATGRIYSIYTNAPANWRTSSKAPSIHGSNMQNWGKREDNHWAKEARATVIARPGHVFVNVDSKAIEALYTGWFMRDLNFMKLSAQGVYSWLQAKEHGVEFTQEVAARLKKSDDRGYRRKKQTTLGTLYGMDAPMLFETYPDDFASVADAQKEQDFLFESLPSLKTFQTEVRVRAHKETFLQSPWNYRRYFYDVFVWKKDRFGLWKKAEGPTADQAVAFLPANSAAAFARDNLLMLEDTWLRDYKPANLFVHDGYIFDVPKAKAEKAAELIVSVLTRAVPEMHGLRCGCEAEIGANWGDYDTDKNPNGMKVLKAVIMEPDEHMLPGAELLAT